MGLIYRQLILQAIYCSMAPLRSMRKFLSNSERTHFSFIDLNNRSGPVAKTEFNNYYYFKLYWYLLEAQNNLPCQFYLSSG